MEARLLFYENEVQRTLTLVEQQVSSKFVHVQRGDTLSLVDPQNPEAQPTQYRVVDKDWFVRDSGEIGLLTLFLEEND